MEIKILALAALWQCVQFFLMAVPVNKEVGTAKTLSSRDKATLGKPLQDQVSDRTARLIRALNNHYEALILFSVAVFSVTLTGSSSSFTIACAWIYLASRILYVAAYAFDWVPWRSVFFTAGFLASALMLLVVVFH